MSTTMNTIMATDLEADLDGAVSTLYQVILMMMSTTMNTTMTTDLEADLDGVMSTTMNTTMATDQEADLDGAMSTTMDMDPDTAMELDEVGPSHLGSKPWILSITEELRPSGADPIHQSTVHQCTWM
jgi:hypothetical protein